MRLTGFQGFSDGEMPTLLVPRQFFTELLDKIDDLAELKLTLYLFYLLQCQPGPEPWVEERKLKKDGMLLELMAGTTDLEAPDAALDAALERAVVRNSLLPLELDGPDGAGRRAYALNTENGRKAQAGARQVANGASRAAAELIPEQSLPFRYYQQNFGLLTPLVADNLRDLEREFPVDWICEAMELAVRNNARSLRYVEVILDRWNRERRADDW